MSYQETAVEIGREIENFKKARVIDRFVILSILFHVNYCQNFIQLEKSYYFFY